MYVLRKKRLMEICVCFLNLNWVEYCGLLPKQIASGFCFCSPATPAPCRFFSVFSAHLSERLHFVGKQSWELVRHVSSDLCEVSSGSISESMLKFNRVSSLSELKNYARWVQSVLGLISYMDMLVGLGLTFKARLQL